MQSLLQCTYKAKAYILRNKTVLANTAKMLLETWYDLYVKSWKPELALVGMCVLAQVILASEESSCKQNLSAYGHIHTKSLQQTVDQETFEKLAKS